MAGLHFDDLHVGQRFEAPERVVSRDEVIAFAESFDRNPFHLDDRSAQAAGFPGVIAAGCHVLSLSLAMFFDLHLWDDAILPSPGLDNLRWHRPMLPGQSVKADATVKETVPSQSKPGQGVVRMIHRTFDAATGHDIMTVEVMHRLRRRPA